MNSNTYQLPEQPLRCAKCGKEVDTGLMDTFTFLMYQNRGICLECFYEEFDE